MLLLSFGVVVVVVDDAPYNPLMVLVVVIVAM